MPDLRYYIHQLRVLPFREVVKRAVSIGSGFTLERIGKARARVFGTTISDRDFFERAFGGKLRDKDALLARFRARQRPLFFIDSGNGDDTVAAPRGISEQERNAVVSPADKICGHTFDLLGSGDVHLGDRIDWHRDFKTAYRWDPDTYYKDIEIPYGKADIKVPWELSRFYQAVPLGQAYRLSKDEKYAREFTDQVSDWIDSNRPKFGVNWSCTMDVAIRACNWCLGYAYFRKSPTLSDDFLVKFLKGLYQHGLHIRENLEYSDALTSNHYLADIVGLVYLGVLFPEFRKAAEWMEFAVRELAREMEKQVYADGCDFEGSTCYHRLVLELFFFSTLMVVVNDEAFAGDNFTDVSRKVFGSVYTDRLHKMFEAALYLLKPDGRMPQLGDNDSGRLHVFADRDILDMRYLLTLGAIFFREPAFKVEEFGFMPEALWLFGEKGLDLWQALQGRPLASVTSRSFPDAGWYVMRSGGNYLVVSCGPNGQNGNGGHAHNDKLSFELMIDNRNTVMDPGTFLYTSDPVGRNLFRSTRSHNTVMIDGTEQNGFSPSDFLLFAMNNETQPVVVRWEPGDDRDLLVAEHDGYQRLSSPVVHRREILFYKRTGRCEIVDSFTGQGEHVFEWNIIASPESVRSLRIRSDDMTWREESAFYSPAYGVKVKTKKFTASAKAALPFSVAFSLEVRDGSPADGDEASGEN